MKKIIVCKATIFHFVSSYKYKVKNQRVMKPEKFVGIILITLLISCKYEEHIDKKENVSIRLPS